MNDANPSTISMYLYSILILEHPHTPSRHLTLTSYRFCSHELDGSKPSISKPCKDTTWNRKKILEEIPDLLHSSPQQINHVEVTVKIMDEAKKV